MPEAIFEDGPVPTPYVYTVTGTGSVTPRACQAVYDGTGAGGSFVPAVIFRSQAGNVIARATLDSTIVAGDDAEVSWFPGVKHGAAAAVATGLPFASIELADPASPLVAGTYAPNITAIHTNTPGAAIFSVDPLQPTYVQIAEKGIYGMYGCFAMSGPATMTVGSVLAVTLGTTGMFVTLPRIILENANTVATKRIQEATGVTFEQFAGPDKARYLFITGQTFSNIGPLGWAIWQMSPSVTT